MHLYSTPLTLLLLSNCLHPFLLLTFVSAAPTPAHELTRTVVNLNPHVGHNTKTIVNLDPRGTVVVSASASTPSAVPSSAPASALFPASATDEADTEMYQAHGLSGPGVVMPSQSVSLVTLTVSPTAMRTSGVSSSRMESEARVAVQIRTECEMESESEVASVTATAADTATVSLKGMRPGPFFPVYSTSTYWLTVSAVLMKTG